MEALLACSLDIGLLKSIGADIQFFLFVKLGVLKTGLLPFTLSLPFRKFMVITEIFYLQHDFR